MLYLTTRSKVDTYTATWPIRMDRSADGGLFVPFSLPVIDTEKLHQLSEMTYSECVAQVLNQFFRLQLTKYDVEFVIGKKPVDFVSLNRNLVITECWHNERRDYAMLEKKLYELICRGTERKLTSWVRIVIRIALITATIAQLIAHGCCSADNPVDFAVTALDMSDFMAIYYAREMGLPIANIICACTDNTSLWELLHVGQLNAATAARLTGYLGDCGIPENMERFLHATLGADETQRYLNAVAQGGIFAPAQEEVEKLRKGLFYAVVSCERLNGLIPSVRNVIGYEMPRQTGVAYGGLMDYRAKYGEVRTAVIFSDKKE